MYTHLQNAEKLVLLAIMTLLDIIVTIGVSSVIVGLLYIGRKLQILDDLQATSHRMKVNLTVISNFLIRDNTNFDPRELQALSPLTLTPEGEHFITKIGFDKVFQEHKTDFFQCISNEQPKLKYDVELAAIKSISLLYDKDYMNFLKVFFYNNPSRNVENTSPTLGVYIREKYLVEHPEITE